ncbi:hypothetical protein Bca4012_091355 [Brassica carinata]
MQERPMVPPGEQVQELKVAELMLPESCEWDVHKLHLHVPEDQIQCIKPSQSGSLDKVICLGTKTGEYSTKSGYYFAVNMEDIRDEMANAANLNVNFNWKKHIWDLDIAPKVRMFSWKLLKGAIPVGERLAERHVPIEPRCKWCGCSESILHLLFHCLFARKVWSLAPFTTMMECSGMIDLAVSWPVLCDKQCLPPSGVTSTTLAPWILWNLWKARNKFTFEALVAEGLALLEAVQTLAKEERAMVSFESDSEQLIKTINDGNYIPELYGVVADILSYASVFEFVVFVWIPPKENTLADGLAKSVLNVVTTSVVDGAFMVLN